MNRAHLDYINLPRMLCAHILGKDHEPRHRMTVGGFIMVTGVVIAHFSTTMDVVIFKITLDFIGYTFHAVGFVPILDWLDHKDPPPPALPIGVG